MKNKLLIHSCCAPCSTIVIEELKDNYDLLIYYYNPNIMPEEEYYLRKEEQIKYLKKLNIKYIDADYDNELFLDEIGGLENEKEGGSRCSKCIYFRLEKTALKALENEIDYFCTTLTISPHKNSKIINDIGNELAIKHNIKFIQEDFKKREGYKKSIELSNKYNLYRQNYCGCTYSKKGS